MEAAVRYMKNWTATGNDHKNIERLKAEEYIISKTFTKLYVKCLTETRIPMSWKNAKMMIIFNKGTEPDMFTIKHL